MLFSPFAESSSALINLDDIHPLAFQVILDHAYTDEVKLTSENALKYARLRDSCLLERQLLSNYSALYAAVKYQIDALAERVSEFVARELPAGLQCAMLRHAPALLCDYPSVIDAIAAVSPDAALTPHNTQLRPVPLFPTQAASELFNPKGLFALPRQVSDARLAVSG